MTEQEIQKLIADHTALRNDYTELSAKYATIQEEFALMQQQMDWLRKQLFGRKTEQTSVIMEGCEQLSMHYLQLREINSLRHACGVPPPSKREAISGSLPEGAVSEAD